MSGEISTEQTDEATGANAPAGQPRSAAPSTRRRAQPVVHLTRAERVARGKAARAEVPRSSHAELPISPSRPDPVSLLEEQAVSRVPELVPIRYGRMLTSPFAFYRGGALLMASDLAGTAHSGLRVQLCGDAHMSNFGIFGSPERKLLFDINDFDETLPGPWEWDVKRFVTSVAVAGRENGYDEATRRTVLLTAARTYRESMRAFAAMGSLDLWYASLDIETALAAASKRATKRQLRRAEATLAKARTRDSMQALSKMTAIVDGHRRIVGAPPLVVPIADIAEGQTREAITDEIRKLIRTYRRSLVNNRRVLLEQYQFVDMARKVVGVGSVGTRAWIILMQGVDDTDPLFLQAKEAQASVLVRFLGKGDYDNEGERVVRGQRLMQSASDIFLGWVRTTGLDGLRRDFYIRQLRDWKGSAVIEEMEPSGMSEFVRMCGWTLARAHARSGDRIAIASYLGSGDTFDRAVADFAEAYADLNEQDYAALGAAAESGRIEVVSGL